MKISKSMWMVSAFGMAVTVAGMGSIAVPHVAAQHDASHHSPYAGIEERSIKALSEDDVRRLQNGEGMGLALPAELNGYPGPRHVLDLADELDLTEAQKAATMEVFNAMKEHAVALGHEIVKMEGHLDDAFADQTISTAKLEAMTAHIAELRGRLRAVHLSAHLKMFVTLTEEQRHQYDILRGYKKL